jgi:hypothetical protein
LLCVPGMKGLSVCWLDGDGMNGVGRGWCGWVYGTQPLLIHLPLKMGPIVSSETSANKTQTPGIYPKENILQQNFS